MRSLALIALLVGSTCAIELQKGGGNYVRVENGKVVEYASATSLESPQMRNENGAVNGDGSTGDDNIFKARLDRLGLC
jgi:hypothetical protein